MQGRPPHDIESSNKQRSRIRPRGALTKDSYILVSGPDGKVSESGILQMPLLTLGTGYTDCYKGREVHYPPPGGKGVLGERCRGFPKAGFYKTAVQLGLKAVDTAYIYGTEQQIGDEIASEDLFISTKTSSPQFRRMLGSIKHGTSLMEEQLRSLQRRSVNALYNHHDGNDVDEWAALDNAVDQGRTQVLGSSGIDATIVHDACVKSGRCKHQISLVQDDVSPCLSGIGQAEAVRHLANANITLVAHSSVRPCDGEPIIRSIADSLGRRVRQVALRWVLEQGFPVIVQTSNIAHLREDLEVFDFELPIGVSKQLAQIGKVYKLDK